VRILNSVLISTGKKRMASIKKITESLREFRDERDWDQFHNPKDVAIALSIEASELLELFLWKRADEANLERVKEELADVFAFAFLLADKYGLDVQQIIQDKIEKNKLKYPIEKAKGSAKKYTEL
jgi:NTP pyrophosphatase (non-canonical NTP hydrolase)